MTHTPPPPPDPHLEHWEPAPSPRRWPHVAAYTILVAAVIALMAAILSSDGEQTVIPKSVESLPSEPDEPFGFDEPTPEPADDPESTPPTAESLALSIVVDEVQCFGSAGCNVNWHMEVAHDGTPYDEGTPWVIQYEMSGQDDGTHIGTFEILDGDFQVVDGFSSIPSDDTELTATVTRVTEGY